MLLGAMVRALRDSSLLQVQADVHPRPVRTPEPARPNEPDLRTQPRGVAASVSSQQSRSTPTKGGAVDASVAIDIQLQAAGVLSPRGGDQRRGDNLHPPQVAPPASPPPRVATPLPPDNWVSEAPLDPALMPDIPDTMQEEWYKDKARIVEVDPDIQNSIKEIEDLTKDLQLDVDDDDDAFRMLRGELHLDRTSSNQSTGNFRNHNKIFGDKLFTTTGFEPRRYPRTTSRERAPPSIRHRRASVPRVNASRAAHRKPVPQQRKALGNFLPSNGAHLFRSGGTGGQLKSSKMYLDELRSNRASILQNNLMRPPMKYPTRYDDNGGQTEQDPSHDDLDMDKFIRANSQHGSAGSSGSRLSMLSTPEGRLDSPNPSIFMRPATPSSSTSSMNKSTNQPVIKRNFGPSYDDADELILKDIEQEYL